MQILPPIQNPSQPETTRKDEGCCQSCFSGTIIIRNTTARGIEQFFGKWLIFLIDPMNRTVELSHNSRQQYCPFLMWSAIISPNPFFCTIHQADGLRLARLLVHVALNSQSSGSFTLIPMTVLTTQWTPTFQVRLTFTLVK